MSAVTKASLVLTMAVTVTGTLAGCGTGITGDTPLSEALRLLSDAVASDSTLSQLTVSDLVEGFRQYADQFSSHHPRAPLTADQESQLADLQAQLDNGDITAAQFAQRAADIVGDLAPGRAFGGRGMMGGPFRGDPFTRLSDELDLTDEQWTQAKEIFTRLHDDIAALRDGAHEQIKALLTAEQSAALEERASQRPMGGPGGRHGRGPGGWGHGESDSTAGVPDAWATELGLTDEQKTAIESIRTSLRAAVQARHQQARDEFRAMLTADQLTTLDELEAEHPIE